MSFKRMNGGFLLALFIYLPIYGFSTPFVTTRLIGQFGNQLFMIAAAMSLALDNQANFICPDLSSASTDPTLSIPLNYKHVFYHLDGSPLPSTIESCYRERHFCYDPIPYHPNMTIIGWFQSEKYFAHHKEEIINLFSPHPEILNYLHEKYGEIIEHPHTVSIHMRTYANEFISEHRVAYAKCGRDYVENALALFPEDSLFVVFSNDMEWCKKELTHLPRNIRFIEGEPHYHDFYLMSLCKHNIICNSTFSWWAAYLNRNPQKIVVAPSTWFNPGYTRNTKDLIPSSWIVLPLTKPREI